MLHHSEGPAWLSSQDKLNWYKDREHVIEPWRLAEEAAIDRAELQFEVQQIHELAESHRP